LKLVTANNSWKKNRNKYALLLLDQMLNKKIGLPFTNVPPASGLPVLTNEFIVFYYQYNKIGTNDIKNFTIS